MTDPAPRRSPPVHHFGRLTEEAFGYALAAHGAQVRKGDAVPYVSHLLAVASIVIEDGGDEEQVVAALLHDVVEDQGGVPRLEDVRHRFGARVAEIVEACSDSMVEDPRDKAPWQTRKDAYVASLARESDVGILRVSLGDKLHNVRAIVADAAADREAWRRFNAPPDLIVDYYRGCHAALARGLPRSRFIAELRAEIGRLASLADEEMARRAGEG
jgi:(p)ppGpp synthase/HD superfamily hydrolase